MQEKVDGNHLGSASVKSNFLFRYLVLGSTPVWVFFLPTARSNRDFELDILGGQYIYFEVYIIYISTWYQVVRKKAQKKDH